MSSFAEKLKGKKLETLYISRPVRNARAIIAWAAEQGFKTTLKPQDMHVTIAFSSKKIDWSKIAGEKDTIDVRGGSRDIKVFGDEKNAIVLAFSSVDLQKRWKEIIGVGASWDYDSYTPHISITYNGSKMDVSKIKPYTGEIVLGPEDRHELVDDWDETIKEINPNDFKDSARKFFVFSAYGELLDVAMHLQDEGEEVVLYVPDKDYKAIGEGIVPKAENWHEYLNKGYIFVVDGCENAKLQDWLRERGELVVGTNEEMTSYEEDRQKGQDWFKKLGFKQPDSKNFKDFDSAIEHVKSSKNRLVLKQNGEAPKSLNHLGKFDDGSDLLYHLEELKKSWTEHTNGPVDFDLMELVEGTEMAASAFFNGHDWLRDEYGDVVGFLNFEHKKETDGNLGETTGEMGTLFLGVDENNETFSEIMMKPEIAALLKKTDYRGVFDINGSMTKKGFVAFEPTSRFGVPATSYEFMEGLDMNTADLLECMARGLDEPIAVHHEIGMVTVVASKPFPVEADMDDAATSLGQKLWILKDKKPLKDFTDEQKEHIHLENFKKTDGNYLVATKSGYLLTVTMRGDDVQDVREKTLEFIKDNVLISGMKYRQDLGKAYEDLPLLEE